MSTSRATERNKNGLSNEDGYVKPTPRYLITSNLRAAIWGVSVLLILWLLLGILFPAGSHGQSETGLPALGSQPAPPQDVPRVILQTGPDIPQGQGSFWQIVGVDERSDDESSATGKVIALHSATGAATVLEVLYGDALEVHPDGPARKIARMLDYFRAPERALDYGKVQLLDIDRLTPELYQELMMQLAAATSEAPIDGFQPRLAFVTPARTTNCYEPTTTYSSDDYIGAPLRWNEGLERLLRYQAGETAALVGNVQGVNQAFTPIQIMKGTMCAVIASAGGETINGVGSYSWFGESENAKVYIAVDPKVVTPVIYNSEFRTIRAIYSKAAWGSAF